MNKNEFPFLSDYAKYYIGIVEHDNLLDALVSSKTITYAFLKNIPDEKMNFSYAIGKWSLKEALQHLIDTERIMAYRALCIARGETGYLPGFDENLYAENAFANSRTSESFFEEYLTVRDATLSLFKYMDKDALQRVGTANEKKFSPLSLGFVIAGHELHHVKVMKERYLV